MGYSQFGSEEELAKDPIKHLFEIYVKVNKLGEDDPSVHDRAREYFKRMEDGAFFFHLISIMRSMPD